MVGFSKVRVGAAYDLVACRCAVGNRYRNPWRSRTSCALARASFRLMLTTTDEARRIAVNIVKLPEHKKEAPGSTPPGATELFAAT
jgi:hypothetical protein